MEKAEEKIVLVVDDEPDIVFFLKAVLEDHGFQVMTAFNGHEAAERMRRQKPGLISLDLMMPGKSGIRFFYELRKNREWSKIPVLFVTGHAHETIDGSNLTEILEDRTLSGPATYLEKPVNAQTFIRTVKAIMGLETTADEQMEERPPNLQQQVESLLSEAAPETLRKIIQVLQNSKKGE
jgi:DNA-binding response OmpR family regulator